MSETDMMSQELETSLRVIELAPLGYGNPESKIRYEREEDDKELMRELKDATAEFIASGECLVDVTEIDDGCIDGRTAIEVTYIDADGVERTVRVEIEDNHERVKVAGGGYLTTLAMELAIHPPVGGVEAVLEQVIEALAEEGIFCGVHTGSHEGDAACDCGANDKFEPILENGIAYGDEVADSTKTVVETAGEAFDPAAQREAYEGWARTLSDPTFFSGSTGKSRSAVVSISVKRVQAVLESDRPLSASKKLGGDHNERFIVANFRKGKTFSQKRLRELLMQRFPDVDEAILPQVFVVDAPRIVELAEAITKKDESKRQTALQAGVGYQFATAATLTDGSLRVMAIV